MSGSHAHALHYHGHSPVHRLRPEVKLVALLVFAVAVVTTPPGAVWAFSVYALILVTIVNLAEVPPRFFLTRLAIDIPFVLFAFLLPFLGGGPRIDWGPLSLSVEGLIGAWNVLAKASLGAGASVLLAATTEIPDLLKGLQRLRVPAVLVAIASFMIRYLEVIAGELSRTRTAMVARGYQPGWLGRTKPLAQAAGALFIRSYERGERVFQAMLARGYGGAWPSDEDPLPTGRAWLVGTSPGWLALTVMVATRL